MPTNDVWKLHECKICGKKFIPTPKYLYKIRAGKKVAYFCSYTCWRKAGGDNGSKNIHGI